MRLFFTVISFVKRWLNLYIASRVKNTGVSIFSFSIFAQNFFFKFSGQISFEFSGIRITWLRINPRPLLALEGLIWLNCKKMSQMISILNI